ncbi:unnamed protein product, partial [Allacma fusca]
IIHSFGHYPSSIKFGGSEDSYQFLRV